MTESSSVREWIYTKGSNVSLRLRFRPGGGKRYERMWVKFAGPSGHEVELQGQVEDLPQAEVSEVLLRGVVGERVEPGLYRLSSVHGDPGGNLWETIFGRLPFAVRVVPEFYRGANGSEFVDLERV